MLERPPSVPGNSKQIPKCLVFTVHFTVYCVVFSVVTMRDPRCQDCNRQIFCPNSASLFQLLCNFKQTVSKHVARGGVGWGGVGGVSGVGVQWQPPGYRSRRQHLARKSFFRFVLTMLPEGASHMTQHLVSHGSAPTSLHCCLLNKDSSPIKAESSPGLWV